MTYYITYTPLDEIGITNRSYTVFDIEYYMDKYNNEWFSELHSLPIIEGLTIFVKNAGEIPNFSYSEFINDASEISRLRGLLNEKFDNCPKEIDKAEEFHYNIFMPILEDKLSEFAEKYRMEISFD